MLWKLKLARKAWWTAVIYLIHQSFLPPIFLLYSIEDQIIVEGLINDGTIEDMLQEADLTLATTTAKWWSHKAARKSRNNIVIQDVDTIANLWMLP